MLRRIIVAVVLLGFLIPGTGLSGDVQITNLKIPDPEFDVDGCRVTWQLNNGDEHELWVAYINPATGEIENPQLIETGLVPISLTKNGPEWAYNPVGAEIVYAAWNENSRGVLKRAWEAVPGTWLEEELPNFTFKNVHRLGPIGSKDCRFVFPLKVVYAAAVGENIHYVWRELDRPKSEALLPDHIGFSDTRLGIGRWVRDRESLISNALDGDDVYQAVEYDVRTGVTTWLTSDSDIKGDAFMWKSPNPAHEGRYMFFTTVQVIEVPWCGLNVYLENAQGGWDLINQIYPAYPPPPESLAYISSPEPFDYGDHSYITFVLADAPTAGDATRSHIWLASAESGVYAARRISDGGKHIRKDPESFVGNDTAWVYYTLMEGSERKLRMCDTGL